MKNIPLLLLILVLASSCGQVNTPNTEKIRVTGEGKVRVKPNQVILTMQVSFTQPRMVDAVRLTQATVDSVVQILGQYGKLEDDLKTSSVSANKEYSYNGRTPVLIGYQASQSLDFVLQDISEFTELTGKLLGTKISGISQIQFGHSKADSLFREADLLAYDDALKSANALCKRANVTLGKLTFLANTGSGGGNPRDGSYAVSQEMNTYNKGFGGSGFKISPEVLEFSRTIVSEYEIAP